MDQDAALRDDSGDDEHGRPRYSIGQVAQRSGLSRDTLRWYERIGLMGTSVASHRQPPVQQPRPGLAGPRRQLRLTGMPVADMVRYAELVRAGEHTFPDRLEMFRQTRSDVLDKIAELQHTLAVLDYKIAVYEGRSDVSRPATITVHTSEGSDI